MKTVLANKLRKNKKGFTLAELLVVVAIIAVLVAIAVPVFNSATKKAEEAVEVANARSVYAEGMVQYISGGGTTFSKTYDGVTYSFTYSPNTSDPTKEGSWKIDVKSDTKSVFNKEITSADSFDSIEIDGK